MQLTRLVLKVTFAFILCFVFIQHCMMLFFIVWLVSQVLQFVVYSCVQAFSHVDMVLWSIALEDILYVLSSLFDVFHQSVALLRT